MSAEATKRYKETERGREACARYAHSARGKAVRQGINYRQRQKKLERDRIYMKSYRERNRVLVREAKNKPCADCSGRFPPYVMDLHHRDADEKLFASSDFGSVSRTRLLTEIAKCDVLCANCHRERHPR